MPLALFFFNFLGGASQAAATVGSGIQVVSPNARKPNQPLGFV